MTGTDDQSRKRPSDNCDGATGENTSNKRGATQTSTPASNRLMVSVIASPERTTASLWKEKLDISPPQKKVSVGGTNQEGPSLMENEDASYEDVEQKLRADGLAEYLVQEGVEVTDDQKIIHYLYGIEYYKDKGTDERVNGIRKFLEDGAKERMMRFLSKDSDTTHCESNVDRWRVIQGAVLCYSKQSNAHTIFDGRNMPVVMRVQLANNCYRHATGGTLGYKIASEKGDNDFQVHTVDVAKTMRHYYNNEDKLKKRVLENKGGTSQKLLTQIVQGTGLNVGTTLGPSSLFYALELLKKHGPALISRFYTDSFLRGRYVEYLKGGTFFMPQFDRTNDEDIFELSALGTATDEDKDTVQKMEDKNRKVESNTLADVVTRVSRSCSSESHDVSTNPEAFEGADGLHAMILIGGREDGDGKKWFLIQNAWKGLPVLEVSEAYLSHHLQRQGRLVFICGTPREDISTLFLIDQGLSLESNGCDDIAEAEDEEEEDEDSWDSDDLEG